MEERLSNLEEKVARILSLLERRPASDREQENNIEENDAENQAEEHNNDDADAEEEEMPTSNNARESRRLSGDFTMDIKSGKMKREVNLQVDRKSFIQQLNHVYQFAVESKKSKTRYVEASSNIFGRRMLQGYTITSVSLIAVATMIVKIVMELESSEIGQFKPTDFIAHHLMPQVELAYRSEFGGPTMLAKKIADQFNKVTNFMDDSTGFGCMIYCLVLTIAPGNHVNALFQNGFKIARFWTDKIHGMKHGHEIMLRQLDVFTKVFEMIVSIGKLLYRSQFLTIKMKRIVQEYLYRITESPPEGKTHSGLLVELPIVSIANDILQTQTEAFATLGELKDHIAMQLWQDTQSLSYSVVSKLQVRYVFAKHVGKFGVSKPSKSVGGPNGSIAKQSREESWVMALLDPDPGNESEDDDDAIEDAVAAFEGAEFEEDAEDEQPDEADEDLLFLAAVADPAEKKRFFKTLPCHRFFRNGVSGCALGDQCKFNHDVANAEMQAKFAQAKRTIENRAGSTARNYTDRHHHRHSADTRVSRQVARR